MSECQIGCITSDDEGRGYYCEECPERRKGDASPLVECNAMGIRHAAHTWDFGSGEEFTCPGDAEGRVPDAPVSDALTEVEWHELVAAAVEMSRKAQQEQQRAEEAEFHVEQLRDALDSAERIGERAAELATERDAVLARIARAERLIDSWERDAPDHSNPVFIGRLRECLRRDAAPIQLRSEQCDCAGRLVETNAHEDTCPVDQERWSDPEYVAAWEEAHPCDHDWLDRPESDTRECLICGFER